MAGRLRPFAGQQFGQVPAHAALRRDLGITFYLPREENEFASKSDNYVLCNSAAGGLELVQVAAAQPGAPFVSPQKTALKKKVNNSRGL